MINTESGSSPNSSQSRRHQASSNNEHESLMTKKALQLSLSPPRCPPFGTAHHSVLQGVRPLEDDPYAEHQHDVVAHSNFNLHSGLREGLMHIVYNSRLRGRHPHLMLGPDGADHVTRFLGSLLPLSWQNHVRDSGGFRSIFDNVVECSIPVGAVTNPSAALSFLRLTKNRRVIRYGSHHESQFIDLYLPEETNQDLWTGMVFFVHGGAWGSGKPWYYRLVAESFLNLNMAVAVVGYRVYPSGTTDTQVADLEAAQLELTKEFPDLCGPKRTKRPFGFCVMGHSSGAHIATLLIVEQAKRLLQVEQTLVKGSDGEETHDSTFGSTSSDPPGSLCDAFVGISGPYDINHHFDYEAARGVEGRSALGRRQHVVFVWIASHFVLFSSSRAIAHESLQRSYQRTISMEFSRS